MATGHVDHAAIVDFKFAPRGLVARERGFVPSARAVVIPRGALDVCLGKRREIREIDRPRETLSERGRIGFRAIGAT